MSAKVAPVEPLHPRSRATLIGHQGNTDLHDREQQRIMGSYGTIAELGRAVEQKPVVYLRYLVGRHTVESRRSGCHAIGTGAQARKHLIPDRVARTLLLFYT